MALFEVAPMLLFCRPGQRFRPLMVPATIFSA